MWSLAAYLSDASASSNCPGTTATIQSRLQSMAREAVASRRDGFSPGEPNGVSASPASHKSLGHRQAQSSNQVPRSHRRHNFYKAQCRKFRGGSSHTQFLLVPYRPPGASALRWPGMANPRWKWACFIDGRRGRVAAVLPHPLLLVLPRRFQLQKVRPVIPRLLLKT